MSVFSDVVKDDVLSVLEGEDKTTFTSLKDVVSDKTLKVIIEEMKFTKMTEIQHKSIRPLLEGR